MSPELIGPRRQNSLLWLRPRRPPGPLVPLKPYGKWTDVVGAVSGRPVVNLQVGGLSIGALVDMGASCTLLRLDIFSQTGRSCSSTQAAGGCPSFARCLRRIFGRQRVDRNQNPSSGQANPGYGFGRPSVQDSAGRRRLTGWPRHIRLRSQPWSGIARDWV